MNDNTVLPGGRTTAGLAAAVRADRADDVWGIVKDVAFRNRWRDVGFVHSRPGPKASHAAVYRAAWGDG